MISYTKGCGCDLLIVLKIVKLSLGYFLSMYQNLSCLKILCDGTVMILIAILVAVLMAILC